MAVRDQIELFLALERGDFDAVLGSGETEAIEFKEAPYRLQEPRQKWELAKDVAALANQRGGVLVFGYRTERVQNQLLDTVAEHRPVPKNLVTWDSYRQTLNAWVRPSLDGVAGRWFPADEGMDHGVFTVTIPPQPEHSRFFIVCQMLDENGSFSGAVGVPVRRGDAVEWLGPDSIQALLREALWWRQRGPAVSAVLAQEVAESVRERISQRLTSVESAAGWQEIPFFALHAIPEPRGNRPDDFYAPGGVKERIAAPNVLRPNGFHIQTYAQVTVPEDGSLRSATDRRVLCLSPDGFFTAAARGDEEFLGWYFNQRRPPDDPIAVNPRVLAEYILEFCRFVHAELEPRFPATWTLWLSTVGFDRSGGILLVPGLGAGGNALFFRNMFRDEYKPLRPREDRQVASQGSAGADAYALMVEFYAMCGAPPDEIPYVLNGEVSEEAILGPDRP